MTLLDAIKVLDKLDENLTIYAQAPWELSSNVSIELEPDDGSLPMSADENSHVYFLEVFIAKEFVDGWISSLGKRPSDEEICKRLISYAINDA
ncbi:MAG: hypothetical protein HY272_03120 [Gammaproteobacteria bacterium]|nr:hypothetical protein [Gammaproteobacteria bacterium]